LAGLYAPGHYLIVYAMTPDDYFKKVPFNEADEHTHQCALFCWAAMNFRNDERLRLLHAIPNGGERNKIVAARMKAEGTRSGVPDIFLPVPAPRHEINDPLVRIASIYCGLYVEMKRPSARLKRRPEHKWDTGGVSDVQVEWLNALEGQGYKVVVCYDWYAAASEIKLYLTGKGLDE